MTDQLPPSKFGAGTTYGGSGQSPSSPPRPAASPAYAGPAAIGGSAYSAPPAAPNPYAATAYQPVLPPTGPPPVAAQPLAPTYPTSPQSTFGAGASLGTFLNSGRGAPMTTAIVSVVGGLWAAFTIIQLWKAIKWMFKLSKHASHLPGSGSMWYYLTMAATVAEFAAVPLLIFGGFLLWQRNPVSHRLITVGSVAVVAANLFLAIGVNKVSSAAVNTVNEVSGMVNKMGDALGIDPSSTSRFTSKVGGAATDKISSMSNEFIVLHMLLPGVLAVVALVLIRCAATKLWLQPTSGYRAPTTY